MPCEKKVVEDISGWLRVYEDGSVDRTWTGPPQFKFITEPVPPHSQFLHGVATRDVTVHPDAVHGHPLGLRVRLYLPERDNFNDKNGGSGKKLPIILHFHGGGFCISHPDWFLYYHAYARLARSVPALVVSVFLPLAPENPLPAACLDGFAALSWLRSVGRGHRAREPWLEEFGDFGRIFLMGDSSGGNLVHEVAARAGHELEQDRDGSPLRLAGAIPIHPGFVRPERSASELEYPDSPLLTQVMVDAFLKLALPKGSTKEHPITCPMGSAAPRLVDLKLPPILLCVAEMDKIKDTEMEYYEAMIEAGKEVELLISKGMGHSFYLNKAAVDGDPQTAAETDRLFAGIAEFIKKH